MKTTRQSRSISTRRTQVEIYPVVGTFAADHTQWPGKERAQVVVAGDVPGGVGHSESVGGLWALRFGRDVVCRREMSRKADVDELEVVNREVCLEALQNCTVFDCAMIDFRVVIFKGKRKGGIRVEKQDVEVGSRGILGD